MSNERVREKKLKRLQDDIAKLRAAGSGVVVREFAATIDSH